MTKITFFKKNGGYYGFKETGHTGYADEGADIICSALSAMSMLIINAVEVSYASDIKYSIDESTTNITVICKSALNEFCKDDKKNFAISGLFYAYYLQLVDMMEDYYDFIQVEDIEKEVYDV